MERKEIGIFGYIAIATFAFVLTNFIISWSVDYFWDHVDESCGRKAQEVCMDMCYPNNKREGKNGK